MTWARGRHYYYLLFKETAIPDKDNVLAMLSLYLSLVAFQLGGLHYCLCDSIKFVITLNEDLGLQLLGKNS